MTGLAVLVVVVIVAMLMTQRAAPSPTSTKFVVYGTEWCGYTTKQRKHLDNKYGPDSHEFVDCDKTNCPGINAFPVTKTSNGQVVKGFNTEL